jgi:hypothetical protein
MIGGGELKIDPKNIGAIYNWSIPTRMKEVRSFMGEAQYSLKFITSFQPLQIVTTKGRNFH